MILGPKNLEGGGLISNSIYRDNHISYFDIRRNILYFIREVAQEEGMPPLDYSVRLGPPGFQLCFFHVIFRNWISCIILFLICCSADSKGKNVCDWLIQMNWMSQLQADSHITAVYKASSLDQIFIWIVGAEEEGPPSSSSHRKTTTTATTARTPGEASGFKQALRLSRLKRGEPRRGMILVS